jgi:nicotinamide-nucleotide amidase
MHAEVIAIGDELTSGQRLDTNSKWLSERLGELGIRVLYHTTVGDDLEANVRVFREAFDRADVIVCTGGLGPTADDLTRQALAEATRRPLFLDEASLAHIRQLFARRSRDMPERNVIQAKFPEGSQPIHNPHGSAPGIDLQVDRDGRTPSRLFALPGVPAEMREMWEGTVGSALVELTGRGRVIRHRRIKCFGVGESDLEQMLPDLIERGRHPSVGITVHKATITLRVTAQGEHEQECFEAMQPTIETIRSCLGDLVFGEEDDELQHAVIRLLHDRKQRLATIEWGPGGLLAKWLGEADEAANVFQGGQVIRGKHPLGAALGQLTDDTHDFHSASFVKWIADAARLDGSADYALAIGPFPTSDTESSQAGQLHFALATASDTIHKAVPFAGHPDILRARAVKQALNLLRLTLLNSPQKCSQVPPL